MWVGVPGRHVKLELVSVIDVRVTKLDLLDASNFEDVLE